MGVSRIRLGIYGASGAGKTSFFRRLVEGNGLPVAPGSRLAQFMNASIGPDGRIVPTTTGFENMEIRIDRTTFELGDWQGDLLSEADDRLDMERRRGWSRNPIARQVIRSDAFFFFFDPTAETAPGKILKHHNEELLRAKQLIDYALESRQNRLLPMLFILGRQDRVQKDPELQRLTDKWVEEVDDYIEESYSQILLGYYPRSLVRKEQVFHRISTTGPQYDEELLDVMEKTRFLVNLADQFRRRDRKRALRLLMAFVLCTFLVLFVPVICLSSPLAQKFLSKIRTQAAPVLENMPSFPASLSGQADSMAEMEKSLEFLDDPSRELDLKKASSINLSLFRLMNRIKELETNGQTEVEEYAVRTGQWKKAFEAVEKRFDRPDDSMTDRDRLACFGNLLMLLTDSPSGENRAMETVLDKYWHRYRQVIVAEIRTDLSVFQGANLPSRQKLREIRNRLDKGFQEVSESKVRGVSVRKSLTDSNDENRKETLLRDIRKAYLACGYYFETYPVNVKIRSAGWTTAAEPDRDYHYRLFFYGGFERKEEYVELALPSAFEEGEQHGFLPARKDFTVNFVLDHPLRVAIQKKHKGNLGEWERIAAWEINSVELQDVSLKQLGLNFYRQFENEQNTRYAPEDRGFRFDLQIRRPGNVPELLWEIVADNKDR